MQLLLLRERLPPNGSGLKTLLLPTYSKGSRLQQFRTVLKGPRLDMKEFRIVRLAKIKKKGAAKSQT